MRGGGGCDLEEEGHDVGPLKERLRQRVRQVQRPPLIVPKVVPNILLGYVRVRDVGDARDFADGVARPDAEEEIDEGQRHPQREACHPAQTAAAVRDCLSCAKMPKVKQGGEAAAALT